MIKKLELGKRKEKRLSELKAKVDQLFDINIKMVEFACKYLQTNDNNDALEIIELEALTDQMQQEIIVDVNSILITEQPKAIDLRLTLGTFVIASELEIIGDYYKKFAKNMLKTELTEKKHQKLVTSLMNDSLTNLIETKKAFDEISHSLASTIARRSEEIETKVKAFNKDINERLVDATTYDEVRALTRALSISRNLERTFAHLTVICEQISYIVKGQVFHYA